MSTCKFVHYEVDASDAARMREGSSALDPFGRNATNRTTNDAFARHYESQFINCDIRTFPMEVLGKFTVIMADPPWDIHMELPYGTMSDDEMRRMNVQVRRPAALWHDCHGGGRQRAAASSEARVARTRRQMRAHACASILVGA